jgi:hypothetical protein
MTWHDLQAVFALQFADDIATAASGEPDTVMRQRLAGLTHRGRAMLRDALDEVDAAAT